ncbi:MAG: AAA family ATPase, partial [Fusobacteriaceae bacterium]
MLRKISIENFGPIKKEVILSMEKGKTEQFPENIIDGTNLLKTLYIYGANNSGKSKLTEAIRLLSDIVNIGKELFTEKKYLPFLPIGEHKFFEIKYEFLINRREYEYKLKINIFEKEIVSEELAVDGTTLFGRKRDRVQIKDKTIEINKDIFYISYHYAQSGALSELNYFYEYLKNIIYIDQQRDSHIAIRGKSVESELIEYLEKNIDSINSLLPKFGFDFNLSIMNNESITGDDKTIGVKKRGLELPLHLLESFGTNVFVNLLLTVERIKDISNLMVIDEIERGVHYALVAKFIEYINENYPNKQLILPTH